MVKKRISRRHDVQAPAKSKYTELVDVDMNANDGLHNASGKFVESLLGGPESKVVLNMIKYIDVGPFKVEGLVSALNSLSEVMSAVEVKYPDLHSRLRHNGMRVVKKIAGKKSKSLHSWGIAIDITIDGIEDVKWNDKTFYGLALMVPIFHEHRWYWGGAFRDQETEKGSGVYWSNEDAMHFEVSKEMMLEWAQAGLLGPDAKKVARGIKIIRPGAKGPQVKKVQEALKKHVPSTPTHGSYDRMTERAVKEAQRIFSMTPTGIICKELLRRLKVAYDIYYEMY
jgi:hypothetical protein